MIHKTAIVEDGAIIGEGTKIWHHCHIREGAHIGKNCSIGRNVYIDNGAYIGNNVKIQNNVSIYDGVRIDDDAFIGPHVTFTNDLYPRSFDNGWTPTPTHIKEGASLGAGVVVLCGSTIGRYSMIGAGTVVASDVPAYALFKGQRGYMAGFVEKNGKPKTRVEK